MKVKEIKSVLEYSPDHAHGSTQQRFCAVWILIDGLQELEDRLHARLKQVRCNNNQHFYRSFAH